MLVKVEDLKVGDRLVSDRSDSPKLISEVSSGQDGTVRIVLEDGLTEWFKAGKIVIAHSPVQ